MAGIEEKFSLKRDEDNIMLEWTETLTTPGQATQAQRYQATQNGILFQWTGTATAFSGVVERCTLDPTKGAPNWAPAEDQAVSGNPAAGKSPLIYNEPARGWWRFRLLSITGGTITVYVVGEQA